MESSDPTRVGLRQTAYRVIVASSRGEIDQEHADMWDSGVVRSDQSNFVPYRGRPLASEDECWWRVRVRDEKGRWTDWSQIARWTMGLLQPSDWKADWIGAPKEDSSGQDPWFRREFDLAQTPVRAVIHVASIGYHELYVNGKRVGDAVLEPAVCDYRVRARYLTYDIGPMLKAGHNVIGIWLGAGWSIYSEYQSTDRPNRPLVLAQATIDLPNGAEERLVTDSTWLTHPSPSRLVGDFGNSTFGGEHFDAGSDDPTWCAFAPATTGWKPAGVVALRRTLSAEVLEPNRASEGFHPASVQDLPDGAYRIDFGKNFAGWIEVPVRGQPGQLVRFQFSELKDQAETWGLESEYVIGSTGHGVFKNRFNYGSGRWVTVKGSTEVPSPGQISGFQVRNSFERASAFQCSNPLLNWINDTTLWTFENLSLGGYVVDCPQRERRGYGGDAHATTQTALDNFGMGAFYTKWAQDWRDVQADSGQQPNTAPTQSGGGGPSWGSFCIHLPWKMYEQYGDVEILRENFPTMRRWLAFLEAHSRDGLLRRYGGPWDFLGDWLWPYDSKSGVPNGDLEETLFFNNCYWAYALETTSKIAAIIGDRSSAAAYRDRAVRLCATIHARFYHPASHDYANGHQNYLAIALIADVPPRSEQPKVWARLEEEILKHRNGHIDAGITGGALMTRLLIDSGRSDLMYTMATKDDYPSWGFFKVSGQTTMPESWDNQSSQLHSSYLYVGAWLMEGLAGIRPGPEGGFKHFVLRPDLLCGEQWVSAHYDSSYGRIECSWRRAKQGFELDLTVPPNSEADLVLPDELRGKTIRDLLRPGSPVANPVRMKAGTYRLILE